MDKSLSELLDPIKLGGTLGKIRIALRSGDNTTVFNAGLSERAAILSTLDRQIIYVASDRNAAFKAFTIFSEYFADNIYLMPERDEQLLYRGATTNRGASDRAAALFAMSQGRAKCVILTMEALLQLYPNPRNIEALQIVAGGDYPISELSDSLIRQGYKRVESVAARGEFSISGDFLTLFSNDRNNPTRISFFDSTIEYIADYDMDTLQRLDKSDTLTILPMREYNIGLAELQSARADVKKLAPDARVRAGEILDDIEFNYSANPNAIQLQWLAPYHADLASIADFFAPKSVIAYDDGKRLADNAKLYYNEFKARHAELAAKGETLPRHADSLLKFDNIKNKLNTCVQLLFTNISGQNSLCESKHSFNINSSAQPNYFLNFNQFYADIRTFNREGFLTIICCGDEHTARSIKSSLYDNNIHAEYQEYITPKSGGVIVTPIKLSQGMRINANKLVIIGRSQLIKRHEKPISKRKRRMFVMPKCGDYVVHEVHGIGLCDGIERMEHNGVKKDYVVLRYRGEDTLYVPVDQMDRLQRYSGSDITPKLSKIGGKDWVNVKKRVKESVREMAFSLVELYRKRQESKGYKYSPDTEYQQLFEDAFEWQPTDDQLRACEEIKSDMERGIIMDRLLCGDVGYGKTEVAFRAIFKTVMEGKQAAILAPTTILAKQHYNTAKARFEEFNVDIVLLTRFQSPKEIKEALSQIKTGRANLIIATHKLLSDKVVYNNLGLLVLDEEQRFGVEHKEKIKVNIDSVNVLTLSATPIPRTLNMALTGIRDISVLETPPKERQTVNTYVTEMSDVLLQDAISRELARGGQVFVLYNRVDTIDSVAARIAELVPDARVGVGHGQMADSVLEKVINAFYNNETNVIVATTIIENGVDLPNANTLIVYDSDRLGLSAMYQLRGRVGRSNRQAYAYFTINSRKSLTTEAMKRLDAVMEYTDFGSGYKIAMRDLEIRGAGNVLGREQSGHICKVGYDMYCKLLKEAVDEINGEVEFANNEVEMQIDTNAYLDERYISNIDEKLRIFKEIAEVSNACEREELIKRLKDNYGTPTEEAINLIDIALLKNIVGAIGGTKVVVDGRGAMITFDDRVYKNQKVIDAIGDHSGDCVLSVERAPKLVFNVKNLSVEEKLKELTAFVQSVGSEGELP